MAAPACRPEFRQPEPAGSRAQPLRNLPALYVHYLPAQPIRPATRSWRNSPALRMAFVVICMGAVISVLWRSW